VALFATVAIDERRGKVRAAKRSDRRSRLDLDAEHGDGTQDKAREPPLISTAAPQLSR
jgi:hypothetical protein